MDLQNIQITDYIWTLQEFNLVIEKNNKLQLKSKEELEDFIKESGLEYDELPQEESNVKLNKTCKTCGETLEISKFFTSENTEDGFEDNCKDCKRIITAATYLSEIIEFIPFESEFTEDELKPHFKNPFQLQAKMWALLDNDLVKKNFENNSYTLTDEKTAKEFLDKYYKENENKPIETQNKKPIIEKDPKDYTKEDQMKLIIEAISEGKSRKEAAEIAQIPLYKITHWYNEGRQGYGNDNANFFKQLKGLEKINLTKTNLLKDRMNKVLENLRLNEDITNISEANETEINEWIEKGKKDIEPHNYFFEKYETIIVKNREEKENEFRNNEINRKIFLENFKSGKTKEESAKNSELKLSLVHEWYLKGKNNEEPYTEFYEKFIEITTKNKTSEIPRLSKTDKFGTQQTVNSMNIILESLYNGLSETEALEKSKTSIMTYNYWLNRGKQEFGELYIQFYYLINEVKNGNINKNQEDKNNEIKEEYDENNLDYHLDELLQPLDEKYEVYFKSAKMNRTGIAWVNINGKQWIYQKSHDDFVKLSNSNIYKLYKEVKEKGLPWGVRNLNLAKSIILKYYEIETDTSPKTDEIEKTIDTVDSGIYAPLPEEYEQSFKSSPMNQSGIAWVNNPGAGTFWIYEKRINGKIIKFKDKNIYNLYKQVKNKNHIWGIRDYSRAKQYIDIPDEFIIN